MPHLSISISMEHNNDRRITVDSQLSGLNKLAIDREMFTSSVDAGFVLALPFQHGDLEPDCVGVLTRGAYVWDKNTSAKLCAKNAGGAYALGRGGHICGTLQYICAGYWKCSPNNGNGNNSSRNK